MRISHSTMAGFQSTTAGRLSALIPPRDYSGLNQQDSQLRVWLPEPAKLGLEELCEINEMSMTAYLTEYFTSYLFGHHELMRMRANRSGLYAPEREVRYCAMGTSEEEPLPEVEPDLGKNVFALKIWIPERLKVVIQFHAKRSKVTVGEFARVLICAHLFGCEYLPIAFSCVGQADFNKAQQWEALDA